MCPRPRKSLCPAASPCTWLSHAPSTISGSDFHHSICVPSVFPSVGILGREVGSTKTVMDLPGSSTLPFLPCRALRPRRGSSSLAVHGCLPDAFQIFDPVGPRVAGKPASHEAQSLHLRYGPDIALPTLNPCRCLHEPKARFPVERLHSLPGRESHPLEAPGFPGAPKKDTMSASRIQLTSPRCTIRSRVRMASWALRFGRKPYEQSRKSCS